MTKDDRPTREDDWQPGGYYSRIGNWGWPSNKPRGGGGKAAGCLVPLLIVVVVLMLVVDLGVLP